jgi:hypothetical protein
MNATKERKQTKPSIKSITIEHLYDESPDTSWLGRYTDKWETGAIKRHNAGHNEYKYFVPGTTYQEHRDALHKAGYSRGNCDELAREYNYQDFKRMERLNNGDWCFLGIQAEAVIIVDSQLQRITSGGLWGIESDSDASYISEVENEQLLDLKTQLKALGVPVHNFDKIEIERKGL